MSYENIAVYIDDRLYEPHEREVDLRDLAAGRHQVKIYSGRRGYGIGKRGKVIYSSSIHLKRGFHTDIVVNRFGKAMIDERPLESRLEERTKERPHKEHLEPLPDYEFTRLLQMVRNERMSGSRMKLIQQAVDMNAVSTSQVKQLMQLFTFDMERLEVAKMAYASTTDKRYYYSLMELFQFESTKEDLSRYIREYQD